MSITHASLDAVAVPTGPAGRPDSPLDRDAAALDQAPGRSALLDQLDQQVRDLVRREHVDPQRDVAVVRRLAEAVVRDHDLRSLTGVVASVVDPEAVVEELVARVAGFGPLQPLLDDPAVEEVWINSPVNI